MRKDLMGQGEQGRDKEKTLYMQGLAWDCIQGQ